MALKGINVGGTLYKLDYLEAFDNKPPALPAVTSADAGKVLQVSDSGEWVLATLENAGSRFLKAVITAYPAKTAYHAGETLDYTGLSVTAVYSDGTTRNVAAECTLYPPEGTEITGTITVMVSYDGNTAGTFGVRVTDTVIASGDWWTLFNNGFLYVYRTGDIPDYGPNLSDDKAPWYNNRNTITHVTISNSVTGIGDWAFYSNSLTSVLIPDTVTAIGTGAFSTCTNLTGIVIPDSVTTIENAVFSGCTSLSSVTIPNSVTTIGWYAFRHCRLVTVTIPDSITKVDVGVFYDCPNLTSVTIPDSITRIEQDAFSQCSALTDVYYNGSEAQWSAILIMSGNDALASATIHYNSSGPS